MDWTCLWSSSCPLFNADENMGVICSNSNASIEPRLFAEGVNTSSIPMTSPWNNKGDNSMDLIPAATAICSKGTILDF